MSCILKQSTERSPGIIIFSHDEALRGVPAISERVKKFLEESLRDKKWIFGVHIQGDCSPMKQWPLTDWQRFIMWPDPTTPFAAQLPKDRLMELSCASFMPAVKQGPVPKKEFDLCIVSRPAAIKRIAETLYTLRKLLDIRPQTTILFIVPDTRDLIKGERTYEEDRVDRRFFDLPMQIFSSRELKQMTFLSSSTQSFGMFPIPQSMVTELVQKSRFLMLTSHREGGPRVIGEAFIAGTPFIAPRNARWGLFEALTERNTLFLEDDVEKDAAKIATGLEYYERFSVDPEDAKNRFQADRNLPRFKQVLSDMIVSLDRPVEGAWYLDNLHMRLAGHGVKHNFQFMHDDESFFHWIQSVTKGDPYDEDASWRTEVRIEKAPKQKNSKGIGKMFGLS